MRLTRMIGLLLLAISSNSLVLAQQVGVRASSGACSTALPNADQLALLRWYGANVVTRIRTASRLMVRISGWSAPPPIR